MPQGTRVSPCRIQLPHPHAEQQLGWWDGGGSSGRGLLVSQDEPSPQSHAECLSVVDIEQSEILLRLPWRSGLVNAPLPVMELPGQRTT